MLLDELWDFDDPAGSEHRFRGALADLDLYPAARAELTTQLARAVGLQGRFDEARVLLDPLAAHDDPVVLARVRLERGRLLNSSGAAAESIPLFTGALDVAAGAGEDFLAADAAHMLAIVDGDRASAWTDRALAIVRASADPRVARWAGPLYTNSGWSRHEAADFPGALRDFGDALAAYTRHGTAEQVRIAQWSAARALRSVGRFDEALDIQRLLAAAGPDDGYVFEELAELGVALRLPADEVSAAARRAVDLLEADEWVRANEADRLARLRLLATGAVS